MDIKRLIEDNRALAFICLCMVIGILLIGLWPFDFFPKNDVWWLKEKNGLHFHGSEISTRFSAGGVALSPKPLTLPTQSLPRKGSVSMEIWARPAVESGGCRYHIVTFCDDSKNEILFVGQWKSYLLVRWLVAGARSGKRYKEIGVDGALHTGKKRFVTITSNNKETAIYLEGKLVKHFSDVCLLKESGSIGGRSILLGNSPEAKYSWAGDLFGLAIYDYVLTEGQALKSFQGWLQSSSPPLLDQDGTIALYTFKEGSGRWAHSAVGSTNSLLIPPYLQFKKSILVLPDISRENETSYIFDAIINVIGFIPFGFFLFLWLNNARQWTPSRSYLVAIILGVVVSLTIELLQIYLPTRVSSLTDLICNSMGTILGVIGSHFFLLYSFKKS